MLELNRRNDIKCIYTKHWFVTWLIGLVLLNIFMEIFVLCPRIRSIIVSIYFVAHVSYILLNKQSCKHYNLLKEFNELSQFKELLNKNL